MLTTLMLAFVQSRPASAPASLAPDDEPLLEPAPLLELETPPLLDPTFPPPDELPLEDPPDAPDELLEVLPEVPLLLLPGLLPLLLPLPDRLPLELLPEPVPPEPFVPPLLEPPPVPASSPPVLVAHAENKQIPMPAVAAKARSLLAMGERARVCCRTDGTIDGMKNLREGAGDAFVSVLCTREVYMRLEKIRLVKIDRGARVSFGGPFIASRDTRSAA